MAQTYTKTVWTTGDFITADRMNNIENALENVSNEVKNASGQNAAEDNTLASRINDMIMIQNTQPTSANNEIWINTSTASPNNPIEIPTEAEFEALRNSVATQYSETATYEVGKYVLHENDLYKCTTAVNTAGIWDNNASKFTRVILGNEVADLKSIFEDTGLQIITDEPYFTQGYITINDVWADRASGNNRCAIIPVGEGQTISITSNANYATHIAALRTFANPGNNDAPDYSTADGWTGRIEVAKNATYNGVIPADTTYLYVWIGNVNTMARLPISVIVGGYDFVQPALINIQNKANVVSPEFSGLPKTVTPAIDSDSTQIASTEFVKNTAFDITQYVDILENGTNIDELITPANYRVQTVANAATMKGTPPTKSAGYKLIVILTSQGERVYQIALINSGTMPIMYRYFGNTGWSTWNKITSNFFSFKDSKNLLPITSKTYTGQGVTRSYVDGVISLDSVASSSGGKSNPITDNFTLKAGTYTLSLSYVNLKSLSVFLRDSDGNDVANVTNILAPVTFTLSSEKNCYIGVNVVNGVDYTGKQIKIQLERSLTQTSFEAPSAQTSIDTEARKIDHNILSAFNNIECVGDSLTWGAVYTSDSTYRQALKPYPVIMGLITGAKITTIATPGYNATEWWNAYKNQITIKKNALAIVFLGTNGGLTNTLDTDVPINTEANAWANTHTGNYAKIVNAYIAAGYKVLLVKCFTTSTSASISVTNNVIQQVADRFGCGIVDNEYISDIAYHYTPDKTYANTLHYNDLGYAAMAHQIASNVNKMSVTYKANLVTEADGTEPDDPSIETQLLALDYSVAEQIFASEQNPVDYNDYKTPGNYIAGTANVTQYITNKPKELTVAHRLFVMSTVNAQRIVQMIVSNSADVNIYKRYYNGTSWSDWSKMVDDANNPVIGKASGAITIDANANLNYYIYPGNYKVASAAVAATITGIPISIGGRLTVVTLSAESLVVQIYQRQDASAAIYMRYGNVADFSNPPSVTWGNWHRVITDDVLTTKLVDTVGANTRASFMLDKSVYAVGTLDGSGNYSNTGTYGSCRICTPDIQTATSEWLVRPAEGYRVALRYFINGVYDSSATPGAEGVTISAGQQFKILIRRATEDTSETVTVNGFYDKALFFNPIQKINSIAITGDPQYVIADYGLIPQAVFYPGVSDTYTGFDYDTTAQEIYDAFDALITKNSAYITKTDLGLCSDGIQHVYMYDFNPNQKVGGAVFEDIPTVFLLAGQHGYEKVSVISTYYLLKHMINNASDNPILNYLRNHVRIVCVPVANPYGFDAKEYKNYNGVNLNRNWSVEWRTGPNEDDPSTKDYAGEAPFDQPETAAVRDAFLAVKSKICLAIDYHTNGSNVSITAPNGDYGEMNCILYKDRNSIIWGNAKKAVRYHIKDITSHFAEQYNLQIPDNKFCGSTITSHSHHGQAQEWFDAQDKIAFTFETFPGFPSQQSYTGETIKASEELIANFIVTVMNYIK